MPNLTELKKFKIRSRIGSDFDLEISLAFIVSSAADIFK